MNVAISATQAATPAIIFGLSAVAWLPSSDMPNKNAAMPGESRMSPRRSNLGAAAAGLALGRNRTAAATAARLTGTLI